MGRRRRLKQPWAGFVYLLQAASFIEFGARNHSTSFQSSSLSGRYKHTYISSNLLPCMGMFLGVLPTQRGDFEIANIITQPGSNLVGCGADETLAETLIV